MTTYCKLSDKNSIVSYKFNGQSKQIIKIKNAPIEVITTTASDNLPVPTYEVITEITATWIPVNPPPNYTLPRTIQFKNNTNQIPLSIFFALTTYRDVPDGYSFWGFESALLNLPIGTAPGGANNGGANGTSNIISVVGSIEAGAGIRSKAATNSARIISVERIDGVCSIEALHNGQRLLKDRGRCPIVYDVACDGDCPPDTVRCSSNAYPGYCCIPCNEIKNEIKAIASQIRSLQ